MLTKWKPLEALRKTGTHALSELHHLQHKLNDLFDGFLENRHLESEEGFWYPVIDVSETEEDIIVRAELPGIRRKDIDIQIQDRVLTIQGEKKRKKKEKHEDYTFTECRYGAFFHSITLPAKVDENNINAAYQRGVLTMTLPKTQDARAHTIAISLA